MRVLIAPDKFAGTLTAREAAEAIAAGWANHSPSDELVLCPMADGGPGFVEVLEATLPGRWVDAGVSGPHGGSVRARILLSNNTAYIESAQACGRHLTEPERAESASTFGVGELIRVALEAGATTIVIGLGGSGTSDGGAGMLAALGTTAAHGVLNQGAEGLSGVDGVDLSAAHALLNGIELIAASDVDNPLTGLFGAVKTYGPQKGIAEERIITVDGWLEQWANATDRRTSLREGAGAAGGLGHALLLLGARLSPGVQLVAEAVGLPEKARHSDLLITGEGAFDFSSRSGKVPYGVAQIAQEALRPCIALAGQVLIGGREMRALGVESAYSIVELVGEERAMGDPSNALAELATRVARTWSR